MIGIDDWKDVKWGLLSGGLFVLLTRLNSIFQIGIPTIALAFDTVTQILIVVFLAPILEELFFRGVLFPILRDKFNLWIGVLGSAVTFSIFHALAYGNIVTMSGAFIGAFVFGIIASLLDNKTNNVIPSIIMHMIVNASILGILVIAGA